MLPNFPHQVFAYGFSYRKRYLLSTLLSGTEVIFIRDIASTPTNAFLVVWGAKEIPINLFGQRRVVRVEDGFLRSVGLGSDFIYPNSLVFDSTGIYFDPRTPSDLENMLNQKTYSLEDLDRAKHIRHFIIENHLTKYNIEISKPRYRKISQKKVIFVPGQVEDDASIILGGGQVKTNLDLLRVVRASNFDAYIIYKPHPDVLALNRKGKISEEIVLYYADSIEYHRSVIDCIDDADEIHTITSLVGFDALLRDKKVVTYGQPFYAGWGLTCDVFEYGEAFARRTRLLSLDELVAGTLVYYPVYWESDLKNTTTCEGMLFELVKLRNQLLQAGHLERLKKGFVRRQLRKIRILCGAFLTKAAFRD